MMNERTKKIKDLINRIIKTCEDEPLDDIACALSVTLSDVINEYCSNGSGEKEKIIKLINNIINEGIRDGAKFYEEKQ